LVVNIGELIRREFQISILRIESEPVLKMLHCFFWLDLICATDAETEQRIEIKWIELVCFMEAVDCLLIFVILLMEGA